MYSILVLWGSMAVSDVNLQCANVTDSMKLRKFKTVCSLSLRLLHNAVGGVLWTGNKSRMPSIFLDVDDIQNLKYPAHVCSYAFELVHNYNTENP